MTKDSSELSSSNSSRFRQWAAAVSLALALSLYATTPASAQDPQDQDQPPPPPTQAPQGDAQNPPPPDSDSRPVISRDTIPQSQQRRMDPQDQQGQDPDYGPDNSAPPPRRPYPNRRQMSQAPSAPVPADLTIPPGTVIFTRLTEPLSSDHNRPGDTFTATLDRPIIVDGWVVARRGQTIVGSVTTAQKAGRIKGTSQLGLELTDITVVDGQQLPVLTELWQGSAGTSHGSDAAGVATTTGAGTIIGAAADGGAGAGIGAGAGAAAGLAAILLTRGKPTVLGPETLLSFRLKDPVTVSTERSQQAFRPVSRHDYDDYNSAPSLRHRGDDYVAYPPPYYSSCGPYWGCSPYYGYYGAPYVGFSYYGGFRGWHHHGFRR